MIVFASKLEDKEFWSSIFAEAGRELTVIEPGGGFHYNVLEGELKAGADTRDLTQFLMVLSESNGRSQGQQRDPYWDEQKRRMLHNAVEIVKAATGRCDPWDLQRFIVGAAPVPEEMKTDDWKAGFHNRLMRLAYDAKKDPIRAHDYELARLYWVEELPVLNSRTRTSIESAALGTLHVLNTGLVRDLIASSTNITPTVLEGGRSILINLPIVAGDATSTFVNVSWKYAVMRHGLRRKAGRDDRVIVLWADEYQKVANSYDAAFLAECRSHRACLAALTQSVPGMTEAMGEDSSESLMSNFLYKIFHAVGDAKTAAFASALCGNALETMTGGAENPDRTVGDELWGKSAYTANFSSQYQPRIQPSSFQTGLKTGGPPDWVAEAIVVKSGQPFSSGEPWQLVGFRQPMGGK